MKTSSNKIQIKKFTVVLLHLLVWIVILGLPLFLTYSSSEEIPKELIVYYLVSSAFYPVIFYTFYSFILPLALNKREIKISTFIIIILSGVGIMAIRHGSVLLVDKISHLNFRQHGIYSFKQIASEAINSGFIILLATAARISLYWYKDQHEKTELALHEHRLELELLKSQINPHFFFNTLNNIYSLVYKKSDDAPAAVMKLSEIMRYLIYESKSEMVPLEREVEQLENFLELERLRVTNPNFIEFTRKGTFSKHKIPPMLLLSFAENAFKHGKRKVNNPGIRISVKVENGQINYSVINYIITEPHNNHKGEGIGMANTRRRLELLYPKCHKLITRTEDEMYEVILTLECSK
jgi:two-component system, LytTR family, sensor kinase